MSGNHPKARPNRVAERRCGDAGKKVTKPYSINCNPFSRAIVSPLSTENPTLGELVSNRLGRAAFTLSPEPGASSCCADLPGDLALYAVYSPRPVARPSGQQSCSKSFILTILSVRRLIALHSGLPLPAVALAVGSWSPLRFGPFRRSLTIPPLPSAGTSANVSLRGQGSRTGELHPVSSRPCRAYTSGWLREMNFGATQDTTF
jgi:hypothetical protein